MARFKVTGPDGATYEVTAPDDATDEQVMGFVQQNVGHSQGAAKFAQPALADADPKPKPVSAGEAAADVAKSAGIGLVQGAIGLATLPGNIEALGRAGLNAGAGAMGIKPPVSSDTALPNYNDAKQFVEHYAGKFYEPRTTIGEYARTAGEFAPAALGGGGLAARAARVAVPAVASETAGQVTSGTALEPWARVGAALASSKLPNVSARTVTPAPADPGRANAVRTLENEGVTALTAGQRTGSERLRWIEDATSLAPGGGGRATAMQHQAAEQFTAAALRRAGVNADRATPQVMDRAFTDIGREFDQFANGLNLRPSRTSALRVEQIANQYDRLTPDGARVPAVRAVADDLAQRLSGPGITGPEYSRLRSELTRMQRQTRANPAASRAFGDIVRMLDAHVVRSAPTRAQGKQTADQIRDMNSRYRNLLAIETAAAGAGEAATTGLISPSALRSAVKTQNKREYVRGRHPLADLARSGAAVITPLRSSGTAERNFAQGIINAPGTVPATITGAIASGGDPVMTALSMVAPAAARAAVARGIMSNPAQAYLANQLIPRQIEPQDWNRLLPMIPFMLSRDD